MKSFSKNLRLLALLGIFAAALGLLRADDNSPAAAPTAVTAQKSAEDASDSAATTDTDKAAQPAPALRSLTDEAPKAAAAEDPEQKEEPAAMEAKEGEEKAPDAKASEEADEAKATPAPEEPKPAKKVKKGKTRHVNTQEQIPFQDIVVEVGQVSHEAISVGSSTTIKGEVTQNAVAIFGSNRIETKARVGQEAIAVFGNLNIDGEVGKAITIFGNLKLGPNAIVHGETVVVFGSFEKDPAAQVGKITPIFAAPVFGAFGNLSAWFHSCLFQGRLLSFNSEVSWAWIIAGAHLLLYVLIALLFGKGTRRSVENLENRPGMSLLSALLVFLLTPLIIVILAIGTVTAVLIPVLIIALFFLGYFGRAVMHAWFGSLLTRFLPEGRNTAIALSVLVGGVLISLLYCIPFLGILLHSIIGSIGLGAAVLTIADSMKREPKAPKSPAAITPKPATVATRTAPANVPLVPLVPVIPAVITPIAPVVSAPVSEAAPAPSAVPAETTSTPIAAEPVVTPIIPAAPTFTPNPAPAPAAAPASVATPKPAAGGPAPEVSDSIDTLPRAGFWLRMGALGIDFILVVVSIALLASITPDWAHVRVGPWVLLLLAAYGAALWKHRGTTIGGIICRIQVVRTDGREIDWTTAIIRGLGCVLSAFAAGLGFIWIAVDRDQESWHDKIAGTAVVRVPKSRPLV